MRAAKALKIRTGSSCLLLRKRGIKKSIEQGGLTLVASQENHLHNSIWVSISRARL